MKWQLKTEVHCYLLMGWHTDIEKESVENTMHARVPKNNTLVNLTLKSKFN